MSSLVRSALDLPFRPAKPRVRGLTMIIDNGLPTGAFRDHIASTAGLIDFVKFGWGTVVVSPDTATKIATLEEHGIGFFFGGTLFEKHLLQDRFDDFRAFCHAWGCRYVEVSNGTVALSNDEKACYVDKLAGEFDVISEVGLKDSHRSERMGTTDWVPSIHQDLDAGARLVITEAWESGRSGICHPARCSRPSLTRVSTWTGCSSRPQPRTCRRRSSAASVPTSTSETSHPAR